MSLVDFIEFTGDQRALLVILPFLSMFVFLWLFDVYLIRYLREPWRRKRIRYLWIPLSHPRFQSRLSESGHHLIRRWRAKLRWLVAGIVLIVCLIVI